ncbi:MAG: DUF72 domain-containing protein [Armatimonadetes bacterium]|nr:DUF72 domain-containing protein [Armatimonadota bacterium]
MIHIGLSGFSYKPWQGEGRFYPPDLKQKEFFGYYASRYETVEVDGSWYRMPTEEAAKSWGEASPDPFFFSFKAHRTITHIHRLKPDAQESVRFMVKRIAPLLKLGKLGPILVQLPPNLKRDDERLAIFLRDIPKTQDGPLLRYAVEFRNETWHTPEVESILREHSVAWVAAETDDAEAQWRDTANFTYARLRKSEYDSDSLKRWVDRFSATDKESYVYCKHEDKGAPWIWADEMLASLR